MRYLLKHAVLFLIYGTICSIIVVLFVYINQMRSRPDLQVWHTAVLDEEFTALQSSEIKNLTNYIQLENRLLDQFLPILNLINATGIVVLNLPRLILRAVYY